MNLLPQYRNMKKFLLQFFCPLLFFFFLRVIMDDHEKKWKDVFNLYDLDKDGKIDKSDFIAAVRVCGHRYTMEQMTEKMKNFGEQVSYDTFFGFLSDPYTGPTAEDLKNALRAFDGKDCGELSVAQIQSLLTTMGDKLPMSEAQPLLDAMPNNAGKVSIAQLVEFLNPPIPSTNPNVPELMKELMKEEAGKAGLALYEMPAPKVVAEVQQESKPRNDLEIEGAGEMLHSETGSVNSDII